MTTHLTLDSKGVWKVYTETSTYIIDFEERKAKRIAGERHGVQMPPDDGAELVPLREDNKWFYVDKLYACMVGMPMHMLTHGISERLGVFTDRRTTLVTGIERVTE